MKNSKNIIVGIIIFLLGFVASTVTAKITYRQILVEYRDIKINVNGKRINSELEPFIYSDRTFVPLRTVAESLNKEVLWNDASNTIDINDKKNINSDAPNIFLVKKVIDGDTIELENGIKVRYIGINAPEEGQSFYEEAKILNSLLVENKNVSLEYDVQKYDQNGRLLAYVFLDDLFINLQIVKEGMAFVYIVTPNSKYSAEFMKAQKEAQEKGLGLWSKSTSDLKISEIQPDHNYDGEDDLNNEWVKITNYSSTQVDMTGFSLLDLANHRYEFPFFTLKGSSSVVVHTGFGIDTDSDLYWNSNRAIWNNNGDTIFLYDNLGNLIDSAKYN